VHGASLLLAASLLAPAGPSQGQAARAPEKVEDDNVKRAHALFEAKQYDKAAQALEVALATDPKNSDILFDLALAQRAKGDRGKAKETMERELALRPEDADAHLVLAGLYEKDGARLPAVLAYLRYLTLAPGSPSTSEVYDSLGRLMGSGIEKDRHDPDSFTLSNKNASEAEMLMTLIAAASQYSPDAKQLPEADRFVKQLLAFTGFLAQSPPEEKDEYAQKTLFPYFSEMSKKRLVEPFGYTVAAAAGKAGGKEWLEKNPDRVAELKSWTRPPSPAR
jgi:tetratricopeptide (TPR) repeat protein